MNRFLLVLMLGLGLVAFRGGTFKKDQLRYQRVRTAFAEKDSLIDARLAQLKVKREGLVLFIRALKHERNLEVWVKNATDPTYQLYKTFKFCSSSGSLGPKRQQGDGQIPEGLYQIDIFNPFSSFYLSMGTSYPNASDRIRKKGSDPGGDIYLHGSCVTIGCIPITDDGIKELYALCVLAKDAGHAPLSVHMFPFHMTDKNLALHTQKFPTHSNFWKELQPLYSHFQNQKTLPAFSINAQGAYVSK